MMLYAMPIASEAAIKILSSRDIRLKCVVSIVI